MSTASAQTVQTIDDALAFERAVDALGIDRATARKFAAALGELDEDRRNRICLAARDQERAMAARLGRANARRRPR